MNKIVEADFENVELTKIEKDNKFCIEFKTQLLGKEFKQTKSYTKEKVRDKRFNEFNSKQAFKFGEQFRKEAVENV